jgi:hypothetical protein
MHLSLKTLLNHVERLEGFVYQFIADGDRHLAIMPRCRTRRSGRASIPSMSPLPHVTSAPVVASRITEDNSQGHRSSLGGWEA